MSSHIAEEAVDERPRAVLYARQSKLNEDGSDASPVMQWEAGEALCAARGYRVVKRFRDVGKSGWDPSTQRDGFEAMMQMVRDQGCDVVVIFTLSRLTRMGAQEAFAIEKEMKDSGVSLVSVREPYLDTSDPIGAGIFAIIAGLAKQESDTKSVFITNTKELARKAGGHVSGSAPWWAENEKAYTEAGVKYVRLRPTEDGAAAVKVMKRLAETGHSAGKVAEKLTGDPAMIPPGWRTEAGKARVEARRKRGNYKQFPQPRWTEQAVLRTLRDPRIAGMAADRVTSDKWEIRRDGDGDPLHVHEPIMTPAEWYVLQLAISPKGKIRRKYHGGTYLLSGWPFMWSYSGATMSSTITKGVPRYRCNREASGAKRMGVRRVSIDVARADDYVARQVWDRLLSLDHESPEDAELLAAAAQRFAEQQDTVGVALECNELDAQIQHTENRLSQLYADRRAGLYKGKVGTAAFTEEVRGLQDTEARCRARLKELRAQQAQAVQLPVEAWTADADPDEDPIGPGSLWARWEMGEKRAFLALWAEWVEIFPSDPARKVTPVEERMTIHWASPRQEEEDSSEADEM